MNTTSLYRHFDLLLDLARREVGVSNPLLDRIERLLAVHQVSPADCIAATPMLRGYKP